MIKKVTFLLCFIATITPSVFAQQNSTLSTCYDCSRTELLSKLDAAKTDSEKIAALHNLIMVMDFEGDIYGLDLKHIKQLLVLNKSAKIIDDTPYRALEILAEAIEKNASNSEKTVLLKKAIAAFDKNNQDAIMLLLKLTDWNRAANEDLFAYLKNKCDYYLTRKQYANAAMCYNILGFHYSAHGDMNAAINNFLKSAELFKPYSEFWYSNELLIVGWAYADWGNLLKSDAYLKKGLLVKINQKHSTNVSYTLIHLAKNAYERGQYKESLSLVKNGWGGYKYDEKQFLAVPAIRNTMLALNYIALNDMAKAKLSLDNLAGKKMPLLTENGSLETDYAFYKYNFAMGLNVKAEKYLLTALRLAIDNKNSYLRLKYQKELAIFYLKTNNRLQSSEYFKKYTLLNDSIQTVTNGYQIASYENEQKEISQRHTINSLQQNYSKQQVVMKRRNKVLWLSLIVILCIGAFVVFIYRQLQKNKKTLNSLRKAQSQLIQSEKMASLGELTAGIAHEIQNPLNFVNNFSDVSNELIQEIEEERAKSMENRDEELVSEILIDIKQNLEKINHHGKRADAIVKGMLQHSRSSSSVKEPTDINKLADEYLRLAYHGLRAKDTRGGAERSGAKSFNAELITNFDAALPKANVIPQDVGRVLLNLFTNAFYATHEKSRQLTAGSDPLQLEDYKPMLTLTTSHKGNTIEITVKDNGIGIPDAIKDKILQPFFTTKPTGEGTGLGLSLSYDIIVKAHGGTISIDSTEGEGATFTIILPIKQ